MEEKELELNEVEYVIEEDDEVIVVCKDCRSIQDANQVMNSAWYRSGKLPPCKQCGGPTMEIAKSLYNNFLRDSQNGKSFI